MKNRKLINNKVISIFQNMKELSGKFRSIQLLVIVSVFTLFLFSSCKEYVATGITLALLPELLFGIFIVVVIIFSIIAGIANIFRGGRGK